MNLYVLEVSGEGCANCVTLLPVLKKLTAERGLGFERLELSAATHEAARRLKIERVPTVLLMDGDLEIARCAGYQPEEILGLWLDAKTEEYIRRKGEDL
jgi:thioredoxin-like negative regulator of GroEL